MLEGILLLIFLMLMMKIPVGKAKVVKQDLRDNGTKEKYMLDNGWKFVTLEDCMEYRELRSTGWEGDVQDFYEWKYDYILDELE